jgi:hypothetical protein
MSKNEKNKIAKISDRFWYILVIILLLMSHVVTVCDFFEMFGFNWCPTSPTEDGIQNPKEIAREFFDKNSDNLRVKIEPIPPLNVNQEIFLQVTNNGDKDAYFLAFSIDNEGQLFSYVSKIKKGLKLQQEFLAHPPTLADYLQIKKGETITIPDPKIRDDVLAGFMAGFMVGNNVGQVLLVVILVNELLPELRDILLLKSEEVQAIKVLENLYKKLESPVENKIGGTDFLQWSSLVVDYEIVSSQTK